MRAAPADKKEELKKEYATAGGRKEMEVSGLDSFQIAHRVFLPAEGWQWWKGWIEGGMKINSPFSLLTRFTNYVTSGS
jgi:hypothetical protein